MTSPCTPRPASASAPQSPPLNKTTTGDPEPVQRQAELLASDEEGTRHRDGGGLLVVASTTVSMAPPRATRASCAERWIRGRLAVTSYEVIAGIPKEHPDDEHEREGSATPRPSRPSTCRRWDRRGVRIAAPVTPRDTGQEMRPQCRGSSLQRTSGEFCHIRRPAAKETRANPVNHPSRRSLQRIQNVENDPEHQTSGDGTRGRIETNVTAPFPSSSAFPRSVG